MFGNGLIWTVQNFGFAGRLASPIKPTVTFVHAGLILLFIQLLGLGKHSSSV
jgi:hypothetical protein